MNKQLIYDIITDNLPIGFSLVDLDGIIFDFNRSAEKITGYSKEEVIGKSHLEILQCATDENPCPLFKDTLIKQKQAVATETTIRKKNRELIALSVITAPLFNDSGYFTGGVVLFWDITEVKKLERERKTILSMLVHDMKNPVVTAGGFMQRLLLGKAGPTTEKQRDYLKLVTDEINKLEFLITDLLDFSRFEATECRPVTAPFDFKAVLRKHVDAARIKAEERQITLSFECPEEGDIVVAADARLIDRVIGNLLDNAIRYTNPGGAVTISISREDGTVLVRVSDTGIGIAEDHLPYIFDAFHRVSRDSPGSGLGLSIAKTIVEAHGGRIWVESVYGQGSTFSFTLPE